MNENYSHQSRCIAGKYKCRDCDFSTLNVWVAKQHFADKNGIDVNVIEEKIN